MSECEFLKDATPDDQFLVGILEKDWWYVIKNILKYKTKAFVSRLLKKVKSPIASAIEQLRNMIK